MMQQMQVQQQVAGNNGVSAAGFPVVGMQGPNAMPKVSTSFKVFFDSSARDEGMDTDDCPSEDYDNDPFYQEKASMFHGSGIAVANTANNANDAAPGEGNLAGGFLDEQEPAADANQVEGALVDQQNNGLQLNKIASDANGLNELLGQDNEEADADFDQQIQLQQAQAAVANGGDQNDQGVTQTNNESALPQNIVQASQNVSSNVSNLDPNTIGNHNNDPLQNHLSANQNINNTTIDDAALNQQAQSANFLNAVNLNLHELTTPRQSIIKFNMDRRDCSFIHYLFVKDKMAEICKVRNEIDQCVGDFRRLSQFNPSMPFGSIGNPYQMFFNYDLDTTTWRHIVNKEICSTYDRLLIEKQLQEQKRRQKELEKQVYQTEQDIEKIRNQKRDLRKRIADGYQPMQNNFHTQSGYSGQSNGNNANNGQGYQQSGYHHQYGSSSGSGARGSGGYGSNSRGRDRAGNNNYGSGHNNHGHHGASNSSHDYHHGRDHHGSDANGGGGAGYQRHGGHEHGNNRRGITPTRESGRFERRNHHYSQQQNHHQNSSFNNDRHYHHH